MHRFKKHGIGALVVLGAAAVLAAVFVTGALGEEGQDQPIEFTHNVRDAPARRSRAPSSATARPRRPARPSARHRPS